MMDTSSFRVIVRVPIHSYALNLLERETSVYLFERLPSEDELIDHVENANAILTTLNDKKSKV